MNFLSGLAKETANLPIILVPDARDHCCMDPGSRTADSGLSVVTEVPLALCLEKYMAQPKLAPTTNQAEKNRFFVTSSGGWIKIAGVLSEGAAMGGLREAFRSAFSGIDLSALNAASWNGLLLLDALVKSHKGPNKIELANVPFNIYRFLRLLPAFADNYEVSSAELPIVSPLSSLLAQASPTGSRDTLIRFERKDIEAMQEAHLKGNAFFETKIGPLLGRIGPNKVPTDIDDDCKSLYLVHDYASFAESILALSEDLSESLVISIRRIKTELTNALKNIGDIADQVSLTEIKADLKIFKSREERTKILQKLTQEADTAEQNLIVSSASLKENIERSRKELIAVITESQTAILLRRAGAAPDLPVTDELIRKFMHSCLQIKAAAGSSESIGTLAGGLLSLSPGIDYGVALFQEFQDQAARLSEKDAKLIMNSLDLMNPLAEEDPATAAEEGQEAMKVLTEELSALSRASQGCDLMRQILEHRMAEAELVAKLPGAGQPEKNDEAGGLSSFFVMSKSELLALTMRKLVTDQEKFAFEFFLSHEEEEKKDKVDSGARPGEVLLF